MTDTFPTGKSAVMPRDKLFPIRITLPLTGSMMRRVDGLLQDGEARVDFIREAIEAALKRRERKRDAER